jgi:hypothetical protein
VTNLRMEESNYLQAKMMAAEMGLSFNEYLNVIIEQARKTEVLGTKPLVGKRKKITSTKGLFEKLEEVSKMPNKPMGWSEEDEAIYG